MRFVIYPTAKLEQAGFFAYQFRKNFDGTLAIAHLEAIAVIIPDIESKPDAQVYHSPSVELDAYLASEEWAGTTPEEGTDTQPSTTVMEAITAIQQEQAVQNDALSTILTDLGV
jgi:hypothetical protein